MKASTLIQLVPAATALAQHVPTYTNPAVPTGTPLPGNYTGPLRPQAHFSPPINWMNDPNGLFRDANGTWHLYFQFDPVNVGGGNPHWGHATSQDLYHWLNQPIALFPAVEGTSVFSGSAVVDSNNTSGFFPNQDNGVVAIFTIDSPEKENQNIAYSLDGGFTFQYYDGNPVIDGIDKNFRDPQVTWYEDHWVMAVSYATDLTVAFFTSDDLKTWSHASNFSRHGIVEGAWECPGLIKLPVRDGPGGQVVDEKYTMIVSVSAGHPFGGSATQYFPGDFNGTHFTPSDDAIRLSDWAKDNYAGQYFFGIPGGSDVVNFAWASNLQYAGSSPSGPLEGWRSSMTAPRAEYLITTESSGFALVSELYNVAPLFADSEPLGASGWMGDSSFIVDYSSVESNALYIDVNVTNPQAAGVVDMFFASATSGEALQAGMSFSPNSSNTAFFVDRGGIRGFDDASFTAKMSTADAFSTTPGVWRTQIMIDRSIAEFFVDSGLHTGTVLFYPTEPLTQFNISTSGLQSELQVDVAVWALKSAWKDLQDETGIVQGNVTSSL